MFYLDLHVGTSPLSSTFCAVTRASNGSCTHTFLANVCFMLTQTHNLSISGSQACLAECCHCGCAAVKVTQEQIEDWMQFEFLNWFQSNFPFPGLSLSPPPPPHPQKDIYWENWLVLSRVCLFLVGKFLWLTHCHFDTCHLVGCVKVYS